MKYNDALKARDILDKIEPLREFIYIINRKLNILGTAKVILEIDDSSENSDYHDLNRIKLSDNMVNVVRDELNKELNKLYKELYALGEENKDG